MFLKLFSFSETIEVNLIPIIATITLNKYYHKYETIVGEWTETYTNDFIFNRQYSSFSVFEKMLKCKITKSETKDKKNTRLEDTGI